jgi:hypothetical protein
MMRSKSKSELCRAKLISSLTQIGHTGHAEDVPVIESLIRASLDRECQ